MKITTKSGFKCSVNENKVKDWRFVSTTAKISKAKDEIVIIDSLNFLLNFLLGEEQSNALVEHLSRNGGIADVEKVMAEYREIVERLSEQLKKSSASLE